MTDLKDVYQIWKGANVNYFKLFLDLRTFTGFLCF